MIKKIRRKALGQAGSRRRQAVSGYQDKRRIKKMRKQAQKEVYEEAFQEAKLKQMKKKARRNAARPSFGERVFRFGVEETEKAWKKGKKKKRTTRNKKKRRKARKNSSLNPFSPDYDPFR